MRSFKLFSVVALLAVAAVGLAQSIVGAAESAKSQSIVTAIVLGPPQPIVLKAPAQSGGGTGAWSFNAVWDFKSKKIDAVAINDLHELTLHAKPTGFWISAFAGTTADRDGKAVAGIGISHHRQLFDQLYLQSFAGFKIEADVPVSFVVGAGVSYRF